MVKTIKVRRPLIILHSTNGKTRRTSSYTLRPGIVRIPRPFLSKWGFEAGFAGPDYWTHATTIDGEKLLIVGYSDSASKGNLHQKDSLYV